MGPVFPLLSLLPTRVRRNYRGGLQLDRLEGRSEASDGPCPESWLASTVPASNPGLTPLADEGLTRIRRPDGLEDLLLAQLKLNPSHYLGTAHVQRLGCELGFLAKLLDASIRLHVQAHPTAAFAQRFLGSRFGKLEVYYVLGVRPGCEGTLRLGFQHAPSRANWRRIIETQDLAAMDACFEPLPVQPGEVWFVPGGFPHAIGEGVLLVEIMEPSDLVVRCEYERCGIVVPPEARFMGRGLEFCLDIFDYQERSAQQVRAEQRIAPRPLGGGPGWYLEELIGPSLTPCFEVRRFDGSAPADFSTGDRAQLLVQTKGQLEVRAGDCSLLLKPGQAALVAAGAVSFRLAPGGGEAQTLLCQPGAH